METTQNNIPALRFPEFSDNWKTKTLNDVSDYTKGFAFKSEDYTDLGERIIRVSDLGATSIKNNTGMIFIEKSKTISLEKYRILKDEIIITTVGSKVEMIDSAVGRGILVRNKNEGFLNQNLLKLNYSENVDNQFLFGYINTPNYINHIKQIQRGNANQANITIKDLFEFKLSIPSLSEQQKIASFLSAVDEKIQQLKKKKELLEQYKKGLMQQIFSRNIRFKGDNGNDFPDWEEIALGALVEIKKGKQLNASELSGEHKYPALNGGINPSGYTDTWNTEANTIAISEGGNSCGFVNFIRERFWSGGHCYTLQAIDENLNPDFLFQILKFNELKIMRLRVGSGLPNIQKKSLTDFEIMKPKSISEQVRISDLLSSIDSKIRRIESELTHIQNFKKGLLQQMFV